MFKKKQTLPALPSPPKLEEIQDDIQNAENNDVIFQISIKNINGSVNLSSLASNDSVNNDSPKIGTDQELNPEVVYEKVQRFVDGNEQLERSLLSLRELCDKLEEAGSKLDLLMANVRQEVYHAPS